MSPLEIMLYIISPPVMLAGSYAVWIVWREEHKRPPPAE